MATRATDERIYWIRRRAKSHYCPFQQRSISRMKWHPLRKLWENLMKRASDPCRTWFPLFFVINVPATWIMLSLQLSGAPMLTHSKPAVSSSEVVDESLWKHFQIFCKIFASIRRTHVGQLWVSLNATFSIFVGSCGRLAAQSAPECYPKVQLLETSIRLNRFIPVPQLTRVFYVRHTNSLSNSG